jgi:acetyl-CoA carboxylase biotin carboxyl carrier protein
MNLKELKELISLFEEAEITELEIEREGVKIKLKKGKEAPAIAITPQPIVAAPLETQRVVTPALTEKEEKKGLPEENLLKIEAPMVGTFYRAPSPDSSPFVEEGQVIEKGAVVCIIEAMKLMNEIKSEIRGKVKKILVENGHTVEYGQPLFLIEPLT